MKQNTRLFATALAITSGLSLAGSAKADITIDNFQSTGMAAYDTGPWATTLTTVTTTPNGLDIAVSGLSSTAGGNYASAYQNIPAGTINATANGDLYVRLTFTIVSQANGAADGNYCGPTVDLISTAGGTGDSLYQFYGNYAPGTYTVNDLLSGSSGANLTELDQFRIGLDAQADTGYNIMYDSVSLNAAPEPATLALLGIGATGLLIARRRMAKV